MASPNPVPVVKETPPLVRRLFGDNWEDLDAHPDCWNRWFGADSDQEGDEEEDDEDTKERDKKAAKNLIDHNWIKQRLDEEVCRFVLEDLRWSENRSPTWKRAKLLLISCVLAIAAQFPYLVPLTSPLLHTLNFVLLSVFTVIFIYAQVVAFTVPWNAVLEALPSSEAARDGFFVETDMPRYEMEYKVTFRLISDRMVTESCVVPATILFTPSSRITPEPLHDSVRKTLEKLLTRVKPL